MISKHRIEREVSEAAKARRIAERLKRKSPSDAVGCSPRELAAKIAKRLFTDGSGAEATRLELKLGNHNSTLPQAEQSLGGWCFNAAVDQIQRILEENAGGHPTGATE